MSIQALPPATVRIIGASQVLCDPSFVVKELVENALDAHATAVYVEISSNTLDLLQVRDNGHGVAPDDRPLACRRYCTSKIRQYSDLKSIGGKSLGFRGEALACAAELSGTLTITTRVEGEAIATTLKANKLGEVESEERASHPVGTTVRLAYLFHSLPVRKQHILKNSSKCLTKIKALLQSYALARPSVRLSLKVLQTKTKKDWIYVPSSTPSVQDAVFKIIGKDCVAQCVWSAIIYEDFKVQAFLPSSDADVSKVGNMAHFLCIDTRPVSTCRGTMRQIFGMFRDRFKAVNPAASNIRDPFLWMNIDCPVHSYDPNVEPAKDDVLFEDSAKVVRAVQTLFDKCYPQPQSSPGVTERPLVSCEVNLDEAPLTEIGDTICSEEQPTNGIDIPKAHWIAWNSNNFENEADSQPEPSEPIVSSPITHLDEVNSSTLQDVNVTNPWIIAKMNSSLRHKDIFRTTAADSPAVPRECGNSRMISFLGTPSDASMSIDSPLVHSISAVEEIEQEAEVLHDRHRSYFESDGDQTAAGCSEDTSQYPLPREQSFVIAGQPPAVTVNSASGSSQTNLPLPRRIGLRKNANGRAINKPFVSPILNRVDGYFNHIQRKKPVSLRVTRRLDPDCTELDSHAANLAPRQNDPRPLISVTAGGEIEYPTHTPQPNIPADDPLVDEGATPNPTTTINLSITDLSVLSTELEELNSTLLGGEHRDAYLLHWWDGMPKDSDASNSSNGGAVEYWQEGGRTSLLEPPVEAWEMEAWRVRVLWLLEGRWSVDGRDVDVVGAMRELAAGCAHA